jgi:hypothetical protein
MVVSSGKSSLISSLKDKPPFKVPLKKINGGDRSVIQKRKRLNLRVKKVLQLETIQQTRKIL